MAGGIMGFESIERQIGQREGRGRGADAEGEAEHAVAVRETAYLPVIQDGTAQEVEDALLLNATT